MNTKHAASCGDLVEKKLKVGKKKRKVVLWTKV